MASVKGKTSSSTVLGSFPSRSPSPSTRQGGRSEETQCEGEEGREEGGIGRVWVGVGVTELVVREENGVGMLPLRSHLSGLAEEGETVEGERTES